MRKDDLGENVATLQRRLNAAGFRLDITAVFDAPTHAAVVALQKRAGLIADGIAGPKTMAALVTGDRNPKLLSEADIERAAERLGVPVAAIKAVNSVESRGHGFGEDGRPVILYERHVAFRLLGESGMELETADQLAARYPNLINPKRGGYTGGPGEWSRLSNAKQVIPAEIAQAACSWGQFQIMGYHWQALGYESIDAFVAVMHASEGQQLEAFCRLIEADPALHKALKARKWADFARGYNGPAYKENLYDIKLARAYEQYSPEKEAA